MILQRKWNARVASCRCVCLVLGLLTLVTACASAQNPPLYTKWVNYTQKNGFPAGEVFCVTVDGSRVWAGTEHGLVLLENGHIKKIFTTADGIVSNVVMSVAVDPQSGDVWIAAFGGAQRLFCRTVSQLHQHVEWPSQ